MIEVQLYKTAVTKYARHFLQGQVKYKWSVCGTELIFSNLYYPGKVSSQKFKTGNAARMCQLVGELLIIENIEKNQIMGEFRL